MSFFSNSQYMRGFKWRLKDPSSESLLERYKCQLLRANIVGGGSNQFVICPLLKDVSSPSCDSRHHKDRREKFSWYTTLVVSGCREEVQVGVFVLLIDDSFFDVLTYLE